MGLDKEQAQEYGVNVQEIGTPGSSPDLTHYEADVTRDGHTTKFQGTSEQGVLEQAESFLQGRGEIPVEDAPEQVTGAFVPEVSNQPNGEEPNVYDQEAEAQETEVVEADAQE